MLGGQSLLNSVAVDFLTGHGKTIEDQLHRQLAFVVIQPGNFDLRFYGAGRRQFQFAVVASCLDSLFGCH